MMHRASYYLYRPDADNFAGIGASPEWRERIINLHYSDIPVSEKWVPVAFHGFEDNPATEGDFPSLSDFWNIPVMSQRAWNALQPLIGSCCEALPIIHPTGKPYFIIHVMKTVDCLDPSRSEVKRYTDGGVMRVIRYAFNFKDIKNMHVFKTPEHWGSDLIVDDYFRKSVEVNNLKGLLLKNIN